MKANSTRRLLLLMMGGQLLWLMAIWLTGVTSAATKVWGVMGYTVVTGFILLRSPVWLEQKAGRLAVWLGQPVVYGLAGLLASAAMLFYASQQRIWPYDEVGSMQAALVVAEEGIGALFVDYERRPWLGKQHPPLSPLLFGAAGALLGSTPLAIRGVTILFTLGTLWLTYQLGREWYDQRGAETAVLFLLSFPLVIRLGTVAMIEMLLTFFFALALWCGWRWLSGAGQGRWLWGLGTAFVLGLLTKYTMLLILPVLWAWGWLCGLPRRLLLRGALVGVSVLVLPITLLGLNPGGVLQTQLETVTAYAGLVLTNPYGRQLLLETVTNRLPSALGVYNAPLLLMGGWLLLRRGRAQDWLLLAWIGLVSLVLFLTLPDHRYFLVTFPALALLMGQGLTLVEHGRWRIVLLSLLYAAGSLYLYVDWTRTATLFL